MVLEIPSDEESLAVIRFRDPKRVDFSYLLSMLHGLFISRSNTIGVPGGLIELAMEIILAPTVETLIAGASASHLRYNHL